MLKTDVENIGLQKKGVLINLDHDEYEKYVQQREILNGKNDEIQGLKAQINILQTQMSLILSRLEEA